MLYDRWKAKSPSHFIIYIQRCVCRSSVQLCAKKKKIFFTMVYLRQRRIGMVRIGIVYVAIKCKFRRVVVLVSRDFPFKCMPESVCVCSAKVLKRLAAHSLLCHFNRFSITCTWWNIVSVSCRLVELMCTILSNFTSIASTEAVLAMCLYCWLLFFSSFFFFSTSKWLVSLKCLK